jgi:hypothetical protein
MRTEARRKSIWVLSAIGPGNVMKAFRAWRQPAFRRQPHVRGKARAQSMRFQELQSIIDVLDTAYAEGIRTFMCTTHDRVTETCDHFRVIPYDKAIAQRRFCPIAISVLASGAIPPREAIQYVCAEPHIESIVFGVSGPSNIRQTKTLIGELTRAAS